MQEFWFCEACKSMNRGDADHCYRCRAPKAHATMATIHERRLTGVLLPGVDQLDPGTAGAMLTQYPYNPAWPFGYFAVALMIPAVAFQIGFLFGEIASIIALIAPDRYPLGPGWSIFVGACLAAYAVSLLLIGIVHSIFLGLTDMNVPGLGGGKPRFEPQRAFAWWIELFLWFGRAFLTINVPLYIGVRSMEILGLLFGFAIIVVLTTLSVMFVGNPVTALHKPSRLLEDLTERLALRGEPKGLASMWSGAWVTARMIDVVAPLVVVVGTILIFLTAIIQIMRAASGSAPASELNFVTSLNTLAAAVLLMAVAEIVANVIALALLARITLSLCRTERFRRDWVIRTAGQPSGSLPTGHPGYPTAAAGAAAYPAAGPAAAAPGQPAPAWPSAPSVPSQAAASMPPGRLVVEPPAPAAPRPRWIVTQEQFAGGDEATDAPPAEAPRATPIEPRLGAQAGPAPREPGPAEPERAVLRPSSNALPRYGVPGLPSRPEAQPASGGDQPNAASETRPSAGAEAQPASGGDQPNAASETRPSAEAETQPAPPAEPADPDEPDWPEGI